MRGLEQLTSTGTDRWVTPAELIRRINFWRSISLDPCGNENAHTVGPSTVWTERNCGLARPWFRHGIVFVNPPYSDCATWLRKCAVEHALGSTVVALVPARVETRAWQDHVWPTCASVFFPRGRIAFELDGQTVAGAPFPAALILWSRDPSDSLDAIGIAGVEVERVTAFSKLFD